MMVSTTYGLMSLLIGGFLQVAAGPAIAVPKAKQRSISLQVTVPTSGWNVEIQEVYQVEKELWVISHLAS